MIPEAPGEHDVWMPQTGRCVRCLTADCAPGSAFCPGCGAWLRGETDIDPKDQPR